MFHGCHNNRCSCGLLPDAGQIITRDRSLIARRPSSVLTNKALGMTKTRHVSSSALLLFSALLITVPRRGTSRQPQCLRKDQPVNLLKPKHNVCYLREFKIPNSIARKKMWASAAAGDALHDGATNRKQANQELHGPLERITTSSPIFTALKIIERLILFTLIQPPVILFPIFCSLFVPWIAKLYQRKVPS